MISIIGKKYSNSVKQIIRETKIQKLNNDSDIIINYGLPSHKLKFINHKHIINKNIGQSKYHVLQIASKNNILIPKTLLSLTNTDKLEDYISKKYYSIGGKGIVKATTKNNMFGRYYQKFIKNRQYEIRIHSFKWLSKNKWIVQKRIGHKDVIAWNFKNGGKFQNIYDQNNIIYNKARDITELILTKLNMSFGASDFIITNNNELYFLEINSAPGFTDFSKHIYINAFNKLYNLPFKELIKLV